MGSSGIILNYAFLYSAILLFGALSAYLSERVGIINLGVDGMMCFGAVAFSIFSSKALGFVNMGPSGIIFAILFSGVLTMIMGVMHAYATINLKANHVISGVAINLIGASLAAFLNTPLGNLLFHTSKLNSGFNDFLYLGGSIYGSSIIIFVFALIVAFGLLFFMNKTRTGLRYCAIGENPYALDAQGVNVIKYQWIAVLLSSVFAGIAGGLFMFNIKQFPGSCQALGYLALGILIIGAWKVEWIILSTLIFALFTSLGLSSVLTNLGIPREVSCAVPYVVTVFALLFFFKRSRMPEHDGKPFYKNYSF